ncbi:unnamed protein product [Clonostachys rosea f. rosea IK726]|uniref:Uncharacterized protein n=1 Tax=Clonostachys rosea f. rosea IK726 TaxID=1349383 RepID=A0ACA9UTJ7_BIOOC|nr:unnamed protein product [Clonostachys rosea f. rosea IK726]
MAGIWSALKSTWLIAEITTLDESTAPSDSELRKIAKHSVQSYVFSLFQLIAAMFADASLRDQHVINLCDCLLDDLKGWDKNPPSAFKSLQILDYCIHEGSCEIKEWFQPHIEVIEVIGGEQSSQASRLRKYALEIANLLRNEAPLQAERLNSVSWKPRMDRLITRDWASRGSTSRQESSKVEPPPPYTPEDSGKGSKSSVQVTEKSVDEGEHS